MKFLNLYHSNKWGFRLASIYFFGFFVISLYVLAVITFDTANSELIGLYPILYTFPWSFIITALYDALGVVEFVDNFAGTPLVYGFFALLTFLPAALVNTVILYGVGRLFKGKLITNHYPNNA